MFDGRYFKVTWFQHVCPMDDGAHNQPVLKTDRVDTFPLRVSSCYTIFCFRKPRIQNPESEYKNSLKLGEPEKFVSEILRTYYTPKVNRSELMTHSLLCSIFVMSLHQAIRI